MVLFSLLMVLICLNACSGAKISDNVTVYVTTNDRAKDFVRSEIAFGGQTSRLALRDNDRPFGALSDDGWLWCRRDRLYLL